MWQFCCEGPHAAKLMGVHAAKSMGLQATKLQLGSLRKFQKHPLGPDCEESCFYQTSKNKGVSLVTGYQTI